MLEAVRPKGHNTAGRILSMKNSSDTIENRTRDLPDCSAIPQPTAPSHALYFISIHRKSGGERSGFVGGHVVGGCTYKSRRDYHTCAWLMRSRMCAFLFNPYPTAFPYGNGMVLHFYQQQESSTTKTVHKVINEGLKTYV